MEIVEALTVVRKLADGVHPETGEALDGDSLYKHPLTASALNRAIGALKFQKQRERARRFLPPNAGKPWTTEEDVQICEELRRGLSFERMAQVTTGPTVPSFRAWCGWGGFQPRHNRRRSPNHERRDKTRFPVDVLAADVFSCAGQSCSEVASAGRGTPPVAEERTPSARRGALAATCTPTKSSVAAARVHRWSEWRVDFAWPFAVALRRKWNRTAGLWIRFWPCDCSRNRS